MKGVLRAVPCSVRDVGLTRRQIRGGVVRLVAVIAREIVLAHPRVPMATARAQGIRELLMVRRAPPGSGIDSVGGGWNSAPNVM